VAETCAPGAIVTSTIMARFPTVTRIGGRRWIAWPAATRWGISGAARPELGPEGTPIPKRDRRRIQQLIDPRRGHRA
jgi:hypothetical protein